MNVQQGCIYCRRRKALLIRSVCEGFSREISVLSEYESSRCFISKNIVRGEGNHSTCLRQRLCSVHTRDIPSPKALQTLLEPRFLTLLQKHTLESWSSKIQFINISKDQESYLVFILKIMLIRETNCFAFYCSVKNQRVMCFVVRLTKLRT